ncbi:MAG: hypothetical protein IKT47_08300 [Oscillospiraceae bacterium]|nr:hypothetical protein [Oscillospiraceae bacterium]
MKRKLQELLKSLLIVALAANALFLAYKSEVFSEFLSESKLAGYFKKGELSSSQSGISADGNDYKVAARPIVMAVMGDVGTRYAAKYDDGQLSSLYERTANIVGEALGSARLPQSCSENEWRNALARPGIYWDYKVEMPISILIRWLGMSTINENDDYADRFVTVINEQNGVDVYYANSEGYYKCDTAAAADSIGVVMQEFLPNGAYFAFESEEVKDMVEPYTIIVPELADKYLVESVNIIENKRVKEQAAEMLGISLLGGTSYSEKNGTMVYVGVNGIMRVSADGRLSYSVSDYDYADAKDASAIDEGKVIEDAYRLVTDLRSAYTGAEDVYFSGIEKTENGVTAVNFGYYIGGAAVVQNRGKAATVVYDNERMISIDIWMRGYTLTDEKATMLPELQAAAIAGGLENDGSLSLVYYDDGSETIAPAWVVE